MSLIEGVSGGSNEALLLAMGDLNGDGSKTLVGGDLNDGGGDDDGKTLVGGNLNGGGGGKTSLSMGGDLRACM